MNCPNCGKKINPDWGFCGECGVSLTESGLSSTNSGFAPTSANTPGYAAPTATDALPIPGGQNAQQQFAGGAAQPYQTASVMGAMPNQTVGQQYAAPPTTAPQSGATPMQPTAEQGMKWYKFIIYVQLFLAALSLVATAATLASGVRYQGSADLVYAAYPSLKAVDMVCAALFVGMAVFAIYVRMRLAAFKVGAPRVYLIFLVLNVASSLLYVLGTSVIYGSPLIDTRTVSSIVTSIVMIFVNKVYFDKRAHLFVN